jgi:hypothetical protein
MSSSEGLCLLELWKYHHMMFNEKNTYLLYLTQCLETRVHFQLIMDKHLAHWPSKTYQKIMFVSNKCMECSRSFSIMYYEWWLPQKQKKKLSTTDPMCTIWTVITDANNSASTVQCYRIIQSNFLYQPTSSKKQSLS